MKLMGELKEKVFGAETMEDKKAIIAEAGMELTDEELEDVAGGARLGNTNRPLIKIPLKPES